MSIELYTLNLDKDLLELRDEVKKKYIILENGLRDHFISNQETCLAITKLQESWMWVENSLKRTQQRKLDAIRIEEKIKEQESAGVK